jgi:hypothetical protein
MYAGHHESGPEYLDLQGATTEPWGTAGEIEWSFRSGAVLLRPPAGNAGQLVEPHDRDFEVYTEIEYPKSIT